MEIGGHGLQTYDPSSQRLQYSCKIEASPGNLARHSLKKY